MLVKYKLTGVQPSERLILTLPEKSLDLNYRSTLVVQTTEQRELGPRYLLEMANMRVINSVRESLKGPDSRRLVLRGLLCAFLAGLHG